MDNTDPTLMPEPRTLHYVAILRKSPTSDYGVNFPDVPGCITTAGKTAVEAKRLAVKALDFHLDGLAKDGDPIPAPRSLDEIQSEYGWRDDGVPFLVPTRVRYGAGGHGIPTGPLGGASNPPMIARYIPLLLALGAILLGTSWALNPTHSVDRDGFETDSRIMGIVLIAGGGYGLAHVLKRLGKDDN